MTNTINNVNRKEFGICDLTGKITPKKDLYGLKLIFGINPKIGRVGFNHTPAIADVCIFRDFGGIPGIDNKWYRSDNNTLRNIKQLNKIKNILLTEWSEEFVHFLFDNYRKTVSLECMNEHGFNGTMKIVHETKNCKYVFVITPYKFYHSKTSVLPKSE